jgi:hypothetical protein
VKRRRTFSRLRFDITPEKLAEPHQSRPWNPIVASVFYRAGIIEQWGTGTLKVVDWCRDNANPVRELVLNQRITMCRVLAPPCVPFHCPQASFFRSTSV